MQSIRGDGGRGLMGVGVPRGRRDPQPCDLSQRMLGRGGGWGPSWLNWSRAVTLTDPLSDPRRIGEGFAYTSNLGEESICMDRQSHIRSGLDI